MNKTGINLIDLTELDGISTSEPSATNAPAVRLALGRAALLAALDGYENAICDYYTEEIDFDDEWRFISGVRDSINEFMSACLEMSVGPYPDGAIMGGAGFAHGADKG